MDDASVQKIIALAFLFLGLFLLLDQVSVLLGMDISTVVRAFVILAGVMSVVAALALFSAKSG